MAKMAAQTRVGWTDSVSAICPPPPPFWHEGIDDEGIKNGVA